MVTYNDDVPFLRLTASEMREGDVFYTGYGHGTFRYYRNRGCDVVLHYRDRDERAKRRTMRTTHHRKFFIHERLEQ